MSNITVDRDAIPEELKRRDQWLLWDSAADTPRRPHWRGDFAVSWTDPNDWHSFDEAYAAVQEQASWGLGYVFAAGNADVEGGYSALDLDGCVEDGSPVEWLPSLEPFQGGYAEFSPSGGGIHIPLPSLEPPAWWHNVHKTDEEHEGVEFYTKKFFTFTGDVVDDPWRGGVGDIDQATLDDWLAEAYENLTGEDPRARPSRPSPSQSTNREPEKSREELADIETTTDYDDILDAVDQLRPRDLRLSSSKTEEENAEYESWDPGYRVSQSGKSLKRHKASGIFFDMSVPNSRGGYDGFGLLSLFAAEEGIISDPWDRLDGDDWKTAVDRARDQGAPIPEYVGGGDLPTEAKQTGSDELTPRKAWEFWAESRADGDLDESSVIPELALWHVAAEHTGYDLDALPADAEQLPPKAHNRALSWVQRDWPDQAGLDLGDDEDATARRYQRRDEAILTWEDVRYVYDGGPDSKPDKDGGRYAAVRLLRDRYHFATPDDTERLHIYDSETGVYEPTADLVVDRDLDGNLGRFYSQHEKNEILGRLKAGTYRERSAFDAGNHDGQYLCVENGVVDLDSRELLEHSPEYLFTSYLPVAFDPDAEATRVEQFLDEITRREADKQTMLEMLGNCFLPNYDYESFLVLFGEGSNGKSTWFSVIRALLGRDNVTSMTLQTLSDNRFAASNLLGKLANIGEDLPEKKIQNVGTLKDLTGGGETWVEEKGKQGFDMRNRAKLMFAANRPPVLGERSEAIKRRLLPIRLPYQFVPDPDPDDSRQRPAQKEGLVDELTTDEELSGLLNLALDGLERLRSSGDFSLPESNDERLAFYEQFSDPIKEFSINCIHNVEDERIPKDVVYNAYTNFCRENDYEPSSRSVFWRELRQTILTVSTTRPTALADGSRPEVMQSVAFTPFGSEYIPTGVDAPVVEEDGTPVSGTSAEDDDAESDDDESGITPLSQLSRGYVTVEAELASLLEPKPWLAAEGTLDDGTAVVDVQARGDEDPLAEVDQGERIRITNARVTTDETGATLLELRAGTTEVSAVDNHQQSGLDAHDDDAAAADGGEIAQDELIDLIRQHTVAADPATVDSVTERVADATDLPTDRVRERIEMLLDEKERAITRIPNGEIEVR